MRRNIKHPNWLTDGFNEENKMYLLKDTKTKACFRWLTFLFFFFSEWNSTQFSPWGTSAAIHVCCVYRLCWFVAETSMDVCVDSSCCWKNKGSHLSGSLLCENKKKKKNAYPTVLTARVYPKARMWMEFLSAGVQSGLDVAITLTRWKMCFDEGCVRI